VVPLSTKNKIRDIFFLNREKGTFSDEDGLLLENFYRENVKQLQILLGKKMPWDLIDR